MSSSTAEQVIDAFIDVLRDELAEGRAVEVPSLGTFSVEHHPSAVEEADGTRRLTPPKNTVAFTPDPE